MEPQNAFTFQALFDEINVGVKEQIGRKISEYYSHSGSSADISMGNVGKKVTGKKSLKTSQLIQYSDMHRVNCLLLN